MIYSLSLNQLISFPMPLMSDSLLMFEQCKGINYPSFDQYLIIMILSNSHQSCATMLPTIGFQPSSAETSAIVQQKLTFHRTKAHLLQRNRWAFTKRNIYHWKSISYRPSFQTLGFSWFPYCFCHPSTYFGIPSARFSQAFDGRGHPDDLPYGQEPLCDWLEFA